MTFGRPTMIRTGSWDVQEPAMIDDCYLSADHQGLQPSDLHSRMYLFVYSLRLFDIMDEILSEFYALEGGGSGSNSSKSFDPWSVRDLANILTINAKLDEWRDDVPEILKDINSLSLSSSSLAPNQFHLMLQAKALRSR